MKRLFLFLSWILLTTPVAAEHHLLIVSGIGGLDEYRQQFNRDAIRLYQRFGFDNVEEREMIASDYLPAGKVLLMTRPVAD